MFQHGPYEQYLKCRILLPHGEGDVPVVIDILPDRKVSTPRTVITAREFLMAQGEPGKPFWQTDFSGVTWCPGLLAVYGTTPPSLDGQSIWRTLHCRSISCYVRPQDLVTWEGKPHPELLR